MKPHQRHWMGTPVWSKADEEEIDYTYRQLWFLLGYSLFSLLSSLYLVSQLVGNNIAQFIALCIMCPSLLVFAATFVILGHYEEEEK